MKRPLGFLVIRVACSLAIEVLFATSNGFANTYYISYATGSNSNPGTQISPWKTHPYMPTVSACTGTGSRPQYTHNAGDRFIFRGGDIWPNACLPLAPPTGGNSATYDYYGVSTNWYSAANGSNSVSCVSGTVNTNGTSVTWASGNYFTLDAYGTWSGQQITINGSDYTIARVQSNTVLVLTSSIATQTNVAYSGNLFCKPIIDSQSTTVGTTDIEFDFGYSVSPSYVTIDNFEFRNHYWSGNAAFQNNVTILCPATGALVENNFIHAWTHAPYSSGLTTDSYTAIGCKGLTNTTITFNIVENADQAGDSGKAITTANIDSYNLIHDVPNGILSTVNQVIGNVVYNINPDYDPTEHTNCIEAWLSTSGVTGYLIGNVCHDTSPGTQAPEYNAQYNGNTVFEINNVFWGINWGEPALIDPSGPTSPATVVYHLWNNTFVSNSNPSVPCVRVINRGTGNLGTVDLQNNHCITSAGTGAAGLIAFDSGMAANNLTTSPVVVQTPTVAATNGYAIANSFRPTASSIGTVGVAANLSTNCAGLLSSLCSDASGYWNMIGLATGNGVNIIRPTVWDAGAYQSVTLPAPVGLVSVVY